MCSHDLKQVRSAMQSEAKSRFRVLLYPLAIALLTGVLFSNQAWGSFHSAPYFPIMNGVKWTYVENGFSSRTTTVAPGTTSVHGVATKALQESDGFISYWTSDSNGIRLHREFEPHVFIDGVGTVALTTTFNPPIVVASGVTDIGQTANSSGTAETNLGNFSYSATFTIQTADQISVPLREFNALRV